MHSIKIHPSGVKSMKEDKRSKSRTDDILHRHVSMLGTHLPPLALGIGLTMPVAALYSLINTSVQQSQLPAE